MRSVRRNVYFSYLVAALGVSGFFLSPPDALAQTGPGPSGASTAGGSYTPNPRAVSLYNLGLTAHKQGSPESAIIFFKRACDIDPNLADAQYNLGILYQMQKRYKDAIPRFEEVLRIKPTDADAHYQLGCIMQDSGRLQEARQNFAAIAPNNSHFSEAQKRLAQMSGASIQNSADQSSVAQNSQASAQGLQQSAVNSVSVAAPYQDAGTAGIQTYAQQPVQAAPAQQYAQPYVQQYVQQPALSQENLPATAYVPAGTVAPQASGGPVSVLSNSSLNVMAKGFSAPSGLAFDRNGSLYVANYMSNSIERIGSDGSRSTFCSGVNLRGPIGLVIDESNNLYVANYNGGTVVRVSPAGISTVVASGFRKPYYLALDKEGNLYVSQQEDNSVVRIVVPRALGARAQ